MEGKPSGSLGGTLELSTLLVNQCQGGFLLRAHLLSRASAKSPCSVPSAAKRPRGVGMGAGLTLAFCRTVPLPVTMMERGLFLSTEAELTGVESGVGVGVGVATLGCA